MKSEHALRYEDVCIYEMAKHKRIYEGSDITIAVVDNAVVIEDKYMNRIYIIYNETPEKAVETAKMIPEIIEVADITIDKLVDKLARLEKIIVENITRTFFIFHERKEE